MPSESVSAFVRSVHERHKEILAKSAQLLSVLVGEDREAKRTAASNLRQSLTALEAILSTKDRPVWAAQFLGALNTYDTHFSTTPAASNLMQTLLSLHPQMARHEWPFDKPDSEGLDFENIYLEAYKQTRLDDLFTTLIQQLDAVIASGQIDSRRILETLNVLLSTVRRNMRKSAMATFSTVEVLTTYCKHLIREFADVNPIVGPMLKAADATVIELNTEIGHLHSLMSKSIDSQIDIPLMARALPAPRSSNSALASEILVPGPAIGALTSERRE